MPKLSMLNQRGQIAIFAVIFLVISGLLLIISFKSPKSATFDTNPTPLPSVSDAPKCKVITDPKIEFRGVERKNDENNKDEFSDSGEAGYKLIRKDVPIEAGNMFNFNNKGERHAWNMGIQNIDGVDFQKYYPGASGEVVLSEKIYSESRKNDSKNLYFIDWGLVFLVHLQNGSPVSIFRGKNNYWITDIYQNAAKKGIPAEAFKCDGASAPTTTINRTINLATPSGDGNQLQLNSFSFNSTVTTSDDGFVTDINCKPAIYLYPKEKMMVNVKVTPKGYLTFTDPVYDAKTGWNVVAYPDGKMYESRITNHESRIYDYLYYESKIRDSEVKKPEKGYAVKFEQLPNLYYNILPKLGLNAKQTRDFADYWSKALPYSPYYFAGIMDQENVDNFEPLEITPKPDFINRVRLYFERLDKKGSNELWEMGNVIEELTPNPSLLTHNSSQFTVTEWGGMVKMDLDHPFTCSQ